ncbi:hypothetical protein ES703_59594 [subsurface metagenome]
MTQEFKLQPVDILVNVNRGTDPWSVAKRWAVGPYSHAFVFLGKMGLLADYRHGRIMRFPMLFESNGRGAVIQSLSNRYGQEVDVMRLRSEYYRRRVGSILREAINLASDSQAYYDYSVIIWHIIPRILFEKLHLPIPLKYQRDEKMICSEAVLEVFLRARIPIVLPHVVPLPGDFVDSLILEEVWHGKLSPDWVATRLHYQAR